MKCIDLEQGTDAWLAWRKGGIGSSDASAVMGVSPYRTTLETWKEKTNRMPPQAVHPGMIRGHQLEPVARTWYENKMGIMVSPQCVEHDSISYLKASLDGLDLFRSLFVEIKCPNRWDHQLALSGRIPYHYWVQMQYQMLVTGIQFAHYVSFDGQDGVVLDVFGDVAFQIDLQNRVSIFWQCIVQDIEPVTAEWDATATSYLLALNEREESEARLRKLQEQLKELMPNGAKNHQGGGLRIAKVDAQKVINWSKVTEAALGFELDSENVARLLVALAGKEILPDHFAAGTIDRKESVRVTPERDYVPPDMNPAAPRSYEALLFGDTAVDQATLDETVGSLNW